MSSVCLETSNDLRSVSRESVVVTFRKVRYGGCVEEVLAEMFRIAIPHQVKTGFAMCQPTPPSMALPILHVSHVVFFADPSVVRCRIEEAGH